MSLRSCAPKFEKWLLAQLLYDNVPKIRIFLLKGSTLGNRTKRALFCSIVKRWRVRKN